MMMYRFARWTALAICVVCLLTVAGCGYHTSGHAVRLPDNIHTIYVPMFENATQTFRVEQTITAAVVQEFRSRTSYRIVTTNDGTADATLQRHGELTVQLSVDLRFRYRAHFVVADNGRREGLAGQASRAKHCGTIRTTSTASSTRSPAMSAASSTSRIPRFCASLMSSPSRW